MSIKTRVEKLEFTHNDSLENLAERLQAARERFHAGYRHPQKSEDELNAIIAANESILAVRLARANFRVMGFKA